MNKAVVLCFGIAIGAGAYATYETLYRDSRLEYQPLCFRSELRFDGPLRVEFVQALLPALYRHRATEGMVWDGRLMLENRRLSYFAWTTDYSAFVRAQDDAVDTTVERAAQDGRLPDFVERWRATVRHRGRDYDDPEFVRLECDVLQWAALAPSDEAPDE